MAKRTPEERYRQAVNRIYRRYKPRIETLLTGLIAAMREEGFTVSDLSEWSDEEYAWNFTTYLVGTPENPDEGGDMDHTFTIAESQCRDGSLEGIAFSMTSCYMGGRCGGPGMTPYNYSDDLWVPMKYPADEAVENRFQLFAQEDMTSEFVHLMQKIRSGEDS
jgi:hypothetical protein